MLISIITPSYGQLDWMRHCVASVADLAATGEVEDSGFRSQKSEVRGAEDEGEREKAKKLTFGKAERRR